jgi:hypothetical protein
LEDLAIDELARVCKDAPDVGMEGFGRFVGILGDSSDLARISGVWLGETGWFHTVSTSHFH